MATDDERREVAERRPRCWECGSELEEEDR